jgi:hypothetical protein
VWERNSFCSFVSIFFALDLLFAGYFLELIVSHDCDILFDDRPSHFHNFVFVCRIEMSIFPSLQTDIDFIDNVVILSFGDPAPFTFTSNDDYKSSRNDWIRTRTQTIFPHLTQDEREDLMLLSNTIHTLAEAKENLALARKKLAAERQFLFQQGDFIFFHSFSFFLLTSLKFDLFSIFIAQLRQPTQGKLLFCFILVLLLSFAGWFYLVTVGDGDLT